MLVSLLNKNEYKINDDIIIKIPTLKDYRNTDNFQSDYQSIMSLFIITPSDRMVELDDEGIDFTSIDEYDFFISLFYSTYILNSKKINSPDSTKVFKNLDFKYLNIIKNHQDEIVLINKNGKEIINKRLYMQISNVFCELFMIKKNRRNPQNLEAKKYIIEVERRHQKYIKKKSNKVDQERQNEFNEQIVAIVCRPGFTYDFDTINKLTIYDFYACLKQLIKDRNIDYIMNGAYCGFGSVDLNKISKNQLNWLSFRD